MLTLKEHNQLQIKVIIDFYQCFPDTEKLNDWISKYGAKFREIMDSGKWGEITTKEEVENIIYKKSE